MSLFFHRYQKTFSVSLSLIGLYLHIVGDRARGWRRRPTPPYSLLWYRYIFLLLAYRSLFLPRSVVVSVAVIISFFSFSSSSFFEVQKHDCIEKRERERKKRPLNFTLVRAFNFPFILSNSIFGYRKRRRRQRLGRWVVYWGAISQWGGVMVGRIRRGVGGGITTKGTSSGDEGARHSRRTSEKHWDWSQFFFDAVAVVVYRESSFCNRISIPK